MFRGISHRIARQFTAFVFLLFMVNGAIFLVADFGNARRQGLNRLERMSRPALEWLELESPVFPPRMPPQLMERVRVSDASGETLYSGSLFPSVPVPRTRGISHIIVGDEQVTILTSPPGRSGQIVQIAEIDRWQRGETPLRAGIYFLVSLLVSALTYVVGLFFARSSLRPAEETMARLEQFTQDASHELRTPLAALRSSLDLALKTGRLQEGIVSAKQDVDDVTRLVERLLELTRLDQFHLQRSPVDFSSLLLSSIDRYQALANEKRVQLIGAVDPAVNVQGDGALLTQLVGNLLANAIKFSKPSGGTVHIGLTDSSLTVRDEGIGIPPDMLPRIFSRFFQADSSRARGGYGLGLALVKRIVKLHGWRIGATSVPKQGTIFTVTFG
ncbi:MAG: HAMP domain-containing sensor histidine kinase [Candidatus Peribacteraceae bacterium]|nr:HAMP domain-containing sensor histidine kinase [Candidatus Peribacteraceae bacterium]